MLIAQDIAYRQRQFAQQLGGDQVIGRIGRGELGRQRNPPSSDGHSQVQLPAIPPTLIARLAPGRFGVDAGMRNHPLIAVLLMPHAAVGPQRRAVQRCTMALVGPRVQDLYQVPTQAANQRRQRTRQALQPPLPSPAAGETAVFAQQASQLLHQRLGLVQKAQQRPRGVQTPNDHDHQSFQEQSIGVGYRATTRALGRGWGYRNAVKHLYQADQQTLTQYHCPTSISRVGSSPSAYGGSRALVLARARLFTRKSCCYDL